MTAHAINVEHIASEGVLGFEHSLWDGLRYFGTSSLIVVGGDPPNTKWSNEKILTGFTLAGIAGARAA